MPTKIKCNFLDCSFISKKGFCKKEEIEMRRYNPYGRITIVPACMDYECQTHAEWEKKHAYKILTNH